MVFNKSGENVLLNTAIKFDSEDGEPFSWKLKPKLLLAPSPMMDTSGTPYIEALLLARLFERVKAKWRTQNMLFVNLQRGALIEFSEQIERILVTRGIALGG